MCSSDLEPCRQKDPELWFSDVPKERAEAKALCKGCPTRKSCLAYALDHPTAAAHGIWAGTSPNTRAKIRAEFRTADTTKEQE